MSAVSNGSSSGVMRPANNMTHLTQATNPFNQNSQVHGRPQDSYAYTLNQNGQRNSGKYDTFNQSDNSSDDEEDEEEEFEESEFDEEEEDESSLSDYQPSEKIKNLFQHQNHPQFTQDYYP